MHLKALLATLTIVAAALAGCSGDDGDGEVTPTSSSASSTRASSSSTSRSSSSSSASSTSTGAAPNGAPTGSISVAVNGTSASFSLAGTDPDGDPLTWDLDFGDGASTDGATLPANATHTYAAAGNFTANFTISDGKDETTYDVTVAVTGPGGATQQAFAGSWEAGGPIACEQIADGDDLQQVATQLEGIGFVSFAVESVALGKPFTVTIAPTAPAGLYELDFYDAGGANLGYFPETDPTAADMTGFEGEVPKNAATAVFFPCTAGPGEFTFTAG